MIERNDPDLTISDIIEGVLSARRQYTSAPKENLFLPTRWDTFGMELVDIQLVDPLQKLLQKGAAESHVDPGPQGAAEARVEPDLSGQRTAESRRDVEPAPVPTDESNGDPVEVSAESHSHLNQAL